MGLDKGSQMGWYGTMVIVMVVVVMVMVVVDLVVVVVIDFMLIPWSSPTASDCEGVGRCSHLSARMVAD
jgi:hypothetical protein